MISKLDSKVGDWILEAMFEVEDVHEFYLFSSANGNKTDSLPTRAIRLLLKEWTDFYGQIIVDKLQIWGQELD